MTVFYGSIHNVTEIVQKDIVHLKKNNVYSRRFLFKTEDGDVDITAFADHKHVLTGMTKEKD